uniref:Beta-defensin-like domain-containing protein n=1 Tax=Salvator merianae TaxID=96440 RepID=A0A8D0B7N2_SALMN
MVKGHGSWRIGEVLHLTQERTILTWKHVGGMLSNLHLIAGPFSLSHTGYSHARDTLKCHDDKGTCHPTLCPAQKIEKGTCYDGVIHFKNFKWIHPLN